MNAMTSPLQVIHNMFDSRSPESSWERAVEDHFRTELAKPGAMAGVTSLNTTTNHSLSDGQLVKFRCMVQDMFDPEHYMAGAQRNLDQHHEEDPQHGGDSGGQGGGCCHGDRDGGE